MRSSSAKRRGVVVVLVALSLTAMIGIIAIALDGSLLMDQRRGVQAAADAAALAAAIDLYTNFGVNAGLDPTGTAKASGRSVAAANGYNNDGTNSTVTINIPPGSGNFAGKAGYAEAIIQFNQQRGFSHIFGTGRIAISARAVAAGLLKPLDKGVIVLDPAGKGTFNVVGNAAIDITSGAIIVDSTDPAGATFKGNASITASTLDLSGSPGYSVTSGNVTLNATVASNQTQLIDPLAYLAAPATGTWQATNLNITSKNPVTLNPGLYIGGISISCQANVTLHPGIYYMQGGGFSVTGQANVTGSGVMIYNDGGGSINIAGQGAITLNPPTSGPYTGLTLFQNQSRP